jgi:putative hydrolase of the HAD superfamily
MKHRAVIFDLFGTLIPTFSYEEYDRVLARMADLVAASSVEAFREGWYRTGPERSVGMFRSPAENIRHVCQALMFDPDEGAVVQAAGLRLALTRRALTPRPGAVATLAFLRGRGLKIGLISNCSSEVPHLWETTAFAGLMDEAVFSCAVGLRKPDPGIYHLACERLGVRPAECLYLGDGAGQELSGASAVGMDPVQLRDPDENPADTRRENREDWPGPVIEALSQILDFVR